MTCRPLFSTALMIFLLSGCGRTRSAPALVVSPDGSLIAVPDVSGGLTVAITNKAGSELYRWRTGASTYQGWSVRWKDNQTLELDSSDIGAYTLERRPDNTWRESTPGGVFSPNGKLKVQTSWESEETKKLEIRFGEVTGARSYVVRGEFQTDLVVTDPFNCARWDGDNRVIVTVSDGEHSWVKLVDDTWVREK